MPRSRTSRSAQPNPGNGRAAALRLLASRRLTEAQLWDRLVARAYPEDVVRDAVAFCKGQGYLDDRLFARLYVDGKRKAVGDARLVAELVKRGIEREAARATVARAASSEDERLLAALEKLFRTRANLEYPNAARALERLGFPASSIYRHLRARAAADFATFEDSTAERA